MYRKLFVPLDGGPLSDKAMAESLKLARQLGASVVGFVVEPDVPTPTPGAGMARTQLENYYEQVERHVVKTDTHAHDLLSRFEALAASAGVSCERLHARTDRTDEAIVEEAERVGADLIVMVTHGRSTLGEWIYGSHTKKVLSLSRLPLLVLH